MTCDYVNYGDNSGKLRIDLLDAIYLKEWQSSDHQMMLDSEIANCPEEVKK